MTQRDPLKRDRVGHNDSGPIARANPSRLIYMAHGKDWVMCRHPRGHPFAIPEELWRSFPHVDNGETTQSEKSNG